MQPRVFSTQPTSNVADFDEAVHYPTIHLEWQVSALVACFAPPQCFFVCSQLGHIEYDVPQALPGTPPEVRVKLTYVLNLNPLLKPGQLPQEMVHTLSSAFTTRDMMMYRCALSPIPAAS